jgi:hypothetical protein
MVLLSRPATPPNTGRLANRGNRYLLPDQAGFIGPI